MKATNLALLSKLNSKGVAEEASIIYRHGQIRAMMRKKLERKGEEKEKQKANLLHRRCQDAAPGRGRSHCRCPPLLSLEKNGRDSIRHTHKNRTESAKKVFFYAKPCLRGRT